MVVVVEGVPMIEYMYHERRTESYWGWGSSRRINKKYRHDIMNPITLYTNFKSISVI